MTETHYLIDILILLAAAVIAVPVFHRLGLGSLLGYLTAGAVVGSWRFGLIDPQIFVAVVNVRPTPVFYQKPTHIDTVKRLLNHSYPMPWSAGALCVSQPAWGRCDFSLYLEETGARARSRNGIELNQP